MESPDIRPREFGLSPVRRFVLSALALASAAFAILLVFSPGINLSTFLLGRQDRWLLLVEGLVLFLASGRLSSWERSLFFRRRELWGAAAAIVFICYAGHRWILCGYDLSRDEQMAVFDSRIFSAGLRAQPLTTVWQPNAAALNLLFMLPVERPVAWVSDYLPMNAAFRALVGSIADPALTGPILTALGAIALWGCASRLWPDDREASTVALLLYLASGQVLAAGMTAYAMPAHLTLNLIWLWLFLRNRRASDLMALLVGFMATGLHQPLFHPLFAAPFLFLLLIDRNWPRLALFAVGYIAICAFWSAWPNWTHALVAGPHSVTARMGTDYWSRLRQTLTANSSWRWIDMAANLLRFAAWQPILLLPLAAGGIANARRDRLAGALTASLLLPVAVMLVILPYQGHGFGYRYLHGVIGSAILLAVYGLRRWAADSPQFRALLSRTVVAGLFIVLPLQLWMAHHFYAAFASVDAQITASGTSYFIIGQEDATFAGDLVINQPDLMNRPIRLLAEKVDDLLIERICRPGIRVGLPTSGFFDPIQSYFRVPRSSIADRRNIDLSPRLTAAGCKIEFVGPRATNFAIPRGL